MFLNILFIMSTLLILVSLLGVIFVKNIMHACVSLLGALLGVAGLYLTLGADFVAAIQLIVYVGGVVILMLFAVMLTGGPNLKSAARFGIENIPSMGTSKTYFWGGLSALVFLLSVGKLFFALGRTPVEAVTSFASTANELGILLITDHVVAFELSSVLLLGALVGAAVVARPKKDKGEQHD